MRERADADLADRQGELAALMVELQIMIEDIPPVDRFPKAVRLLT
jgi:hypothetical protein